MGKTNLFICKLEFIENSMCGEKYKKGPKPVCSPQLRNEFDNTVQQISDNSLKISH